MEREPGRRAWRSPAVRAGLGAVVVVGACFASRPADTATADPPLAAIRTAWAGTVAADAGGSLRTLLDALERALQHGREGTARTVGGDRAPQPEYLAAADILEAAGGDADRAANGVARLRSVVEAIGEDPPVDPLAVSGIELVGIAGQLREAAAAAAPFVDIRRASEATLVALGHALAALDGDDLPAALAALGRASAARDIVAAWEDAPATLPFWLETSGDLIDALERLIAATKAGDAVAANEAAADYADASDEAHQADLALAISISEAGSAIARTPLRRLTAAVGAVTEAQFAAASVAAAHRSILD